MGIRGSGGTTATKAATVTTDKGASVSNVRFRVPPVLLLLRLVLSLFLSLESEEEEEEAEEEDEEVAAVGAGFSGAPVATAAAATMCCFKTARALLLPLPTEACLKWSCALRFVGFIAGGVDDVTKG